MECLRSSSGRIWLGYARPAARSSSTLRFVLSVLLSLAFLGAGRHAAFAANDGLSATEPPPFAPSEPAVSLPPLPPPAPPSPPAAASADPAPPAPPPPGATSSTTDAPPAAAYPPPATEAPATVPAPSVGAVAAPTLPGDPPELPPLPDAPTLPTPTLPESFGVRATAVRDAPQIETVDAVVLGLGTSRRWPKDGKARLLWTGFRPTPEGNEVVLQTSGDANLTIGRATRHQALFTLKGCRPWRMNDRRPLDTRFFGTAVTRVAVRQRARDLEIRVSLRRAMPPAPRRQPGPDGSWFWFLTFRNEEMPSQAVSTAGWADR